MLWLPSSSARDEASIVQEHHEIVVAIESEDGDAAQAAAVRHVRQDLRRLSAGHRVCLDAERSSRESLRVDGGTEGNADE